MSPMRYLGHCAGVAARAPERERTISIVSRHGVGLPLKPSCIKNGPVLKGILVILVHCHNIQTGVVKPHLAALMHGIRRARPV